MRALWALSALLALLPLAGCAAPPSCEAGEGRYLASVEFYGGFGPPPASTARQGVTHDGLLLVYRGRETAGSGRVTTAPDATAAHLPPERLRQELEAMGQLRANVDYAAVESWVGEVPTGAFDRFCSAVDAAWDDEPGVLCLDCPTTTYHLSTAKGTATKELAGAKAAGDGSGVERLDAAYRDLVAATKARTFGP